MCVEYTTEKEYRSLVHPSVDLILGKGYADIEDGKEMLNGNELDYLQITIHRKLDVPYDDIFEYYMPAKDLDNILCVTEFNYEPKMEVVHNGCKFFLKKFMEEVYLKVLKDISVKSPNHCDNPCQVKIDVKEDTLVVKVYYPKQ